MRAAKCITAKAQAGRISKSKAKGVVTGLNTLYNAMVKQGIPPAQAAVMATNQFASQQALAASKAKWRMINRVRVMQQLQGAVNAAAPSKLGSMAVKMVDDIDFEARAWHKLINGRVGAFLEKHKVTLTGGITNPAQMLDVIRAMKGQSVADPNAQALGSAIADVNEWARKKLNSYGYSIGKMDGWGIAHSHNKITIGNAGLNKWRNFIDPKLDWAGMINPKTGIAFGVVPSQQDRDDFLAGMFKSLVYGRDSKAPSWGQTGEGAVLERHRVLKFLDADTWVEYNKAFGSTDPHSAILQHFNTMARHIAIASKFGPTPETAIDYLGQIVAKQSADQDVGVVAGLKNTGGVILAKRMLRVEEGGIGPNGYWGAQSARFFSTTRKVITSAVLDRAVIISVPSDLNSALLAAQAIGMNPGNVMSTYVKLLQDAVKSGGATRDDLLRAQHVLDSLGSPGVTQGRFLQEYPAAVWAERLSNASMRIQGMNAHTDGLREAWRWGMAAQMASDAGKDFAKLDPLMQRAMTDAGVTPADWDAFRSSGGMFTASNGSTFLSPLAWQATTTLANSDELFLKMQSFVEKWTERAVPTGSLIAKGFMDPVAYGQAPGSLPYEVMKSAGMFKSFIGAFVVNQVRMVNHHQGWMKAAYIAELIGTSTAVGAIAIQVGDMLFGRDPQDMTDPAFWFRAMMRGGALGPVGDILTTGATSFGSGLSGYVAGPIWGAGGDLLKTTFGNAAQAVSQAMNGDEIDVNLMADIIRFQKRYTPMWQTPLAAGGSAFDRMISDQLQLLIDPDSVEDMIAASKRRQKQTGAGEFWMPGSALPSRAPDLGTAIGG